MAVGRFDDLLSPRQWLTVREKANAHMAGWKHAEISDADAADLVEECTCTAPWPCVTSSGTCVGSGSMAHFPDAVSLVTYCAEERPYGACVGGIAHASLDDYLATVVNDTGLCASAEPLTGRDFCETFYPQTRHMSCTLSPELVDARCSCRHTWEAGTAAPSGVALHCV